VARQTRAQRRARRQQQDAAAESQAALTKRAVARDERAKGDGVEEVEARRAKDQVFGGRVGRFLAECWGELKKVEWPTQNHVIQATIAVLVACIIVGFYIWVADRVFQKLVQDVLLR
jgi:preprotein translocase subunit SecE